MRRGARVFLRAVRIARPGGRAYLGTTFLGRVGQGARAPPQTKKFRGPRALPDTYLLLDVAGTACALPRVAVSEILPLPDLFRPPSAGAWLSGFLDLGGAVVPVIDLAQLLGLRGAPVEPDLHAHLVLMAGRDLAYCVARATDIVAAEAVSPVDGAHSLNGCVAGEIRLGERLVHLLDPERLLGAEERIRVEAAARAAAARLAALPAP